MKQTAIDSEILKRIKDSSRITRDTLSKAVGVSLPSVCSSVRRLLASGIIRENGYEKSAGGRRARILQLNPDYGCSIGVEVTSTRIDGIIIDLGGAVLQKIEVGPPHKEDKQKMLDQIAACISELLQMGSGRNIVGIGIGISGVVDKQTGVSIQFPESDSWVDVPLKSYLAEKFNLPVEVENEVQAATLGELQHGSGKNFDDILYFHVGMGIGLGIVINGNVYSGSTGSAGEFGHTVVDRNGSVCYCGNYGCLETVAGPRAILAKCTDAISKGVNTALAGAVGDSATQLTIKDVIQSANDGDRFTFNILESASEYLGYALAGVVNVLNPQLVIFGGILSNGADIFFQIIERILYSKTLTKIRENLQIKPAAMGDNSCPVGAGSLVFENFFENIENSSRI